MKPFKSVAILVLLLLIYSAGVSARYASFIIRGHSYHDLFSVESAQHARHAKMVAQGIPIPRYETHLQHPDGYDTRLDTIQEEYLAGGAYRWLPLQHIPFDTFLHYFVPLLFCLGIFGVYGITKEISKNIFAGLYAAAFYAIGMAAIENSMGDTFVREHWAIPILTFQLWFMARAFEQGKWRDYGIAGILYCIALSSWRVMNFFTFVLFSFFALAYLVNYHRSEIIKMLAVLTLCIVAGAFVFNASIRYDNFLTSPPMALAYAMLVIAMINGRWRLSFWKNAGLFIAFMSVWVLLSPNNGLYNHAWQTIFFQLRYLGHKPADPRLLPFDARHLWTPPYTSPELLRFANEMLIAVLLAGYGVFIAARQLKGRTLSLSVLLSLYLLAVLFLYYLLSFKVQAFVIVFLAVFMGYGLVAMVRSANKRRAALLAAVMVLGLGFQAYQVLTWTNSAWLQLLYAAHIRPREYTKGLPMWAMKDALEWISANTSPQEAFVSDISTSPMVAYYANRPTAIHPYFQSPVLERFRQFSYALFSESEDELLRFFKQYQARYLLLAGRVLLNDDHDMSFRYMTDNLTLNEQWAVYKLHFTPNRVEYFTLVYENPFIRIFRYNAGSTTSGQSALARAVPPPLFDETLFKLLSPRDTGKYWKNIVVSYYYVRAAERLLARGGNDQAEQLFEQSVRIIPTFEGYQGLGEIYQERHDYERAAQMSAIAQRLWHD